MICKYCGENMEFDSSEGIGHSEVHHYEEDTWEHGGK